MQLEQCDIDAKEAEQEDYKAVRTRQNRRDDFEHQRASQMARQTNTTQHNTQKPQIAEAVDRGPDNNRPASQGPGKH